MSDKTNPLEQRLKKLFFSPKQRKFFEAYCETNAFSGLSGSDAGRKMLDDLSLTGTAAWRYWNGMVVGCLTAVSKKVSGILALSEAERSILYQIDPQLGETFTKLTPALQELLSSEEVNLKKGSAGRGRSKYTGVSLQDRLIALCLTNTEKEGLEVTLKWRGNYSGFFQYVRATYPDDADDLKRVRLRHQTLRNQRRFALVKVRRAFEMEQVYRDMLVHLDPWYSKLMKKYNSFESVWEVVNNFGTKGGYGGRSSISSIFSKVPMDKLLEVVKSLQPKYQERAELMLGLDGDEPMTITEFAQREGLTYPEAWMRIRFTTEKLALALDNRGIKVALPYKRKMIVLPNYQNALTTFRAQIFNFRELTEQEVQSKLPEMLAGNETVQEEVYHASLRYVLPIAYYFTWHQKTEEKGFSLPDLVQEGSIGLLKAVRDCRYHPNNGSYKSWSNYARASAKYGIMAALAGSSDSHLIRLTLQRQQQVRKYIKTRQELLVSLEREPSVEEIAVKLGVGVEVAKDVEAAMRIYCTWTVSLDAPLSPGNDDPDPLKWQDVIAATEQNGHPPDNPIKKITEQWVREHLSNLLAEVLHPVEQFVLRLSFGFEDDSDWEDDQIAIELGVSEKEVRVIRELGMQKLKANPDALKWMKMLVVT